MLIFQRLWSMEKALDLDNQRLPFMDPISVSQTWVV